MPSLFRRILIGLGIAAAPVAPAAEEGPSERFHHAVALGDTVAVRAMLAADPGLAMSKDRFAFEPVHKLDTYFSEEILDLLVAAGADINARNDEGITILHIVTEPDAVPVLIKRGSALEARDKWGRTPLLVHAYNGDNGPDVVEALLAAGADPHATGSEGETALSLAVASGDEDLIEVLRDGGAMR